MPHEDLFLLLCIWQREIPGRQLSLSWTGRGDLAFHGKIRCPLLQNGFEHLAIDLFDWGERIIRQEKMNLGLCRESRSMMSHDLHGDLCKLAMLAAALHVLMHSVFRLKSFDVRFLP